MRQLILVIACAAALVTLHVVSPPDAAGKRLFDDPAKIVEIFQQVCVIGIAAVGMTLIIVRGGIDISIGSMQAVCAVTGALLLKKALWPAGGAGEVGGGLVAVGVAAGMVCGAALGAVNVGLILGLRIPPIIATLGTMSLMRGCLVALGPREWIRDFPAPFRELGTGVLWPPALLIVAVVVGEAFSRWTALGRSVYLIGNNEKAARVCGVDTWKTDLFVYVAAGALVGLSAMVNVAIVNQAETGSGKGFELAVIAAVVLGGTNIFGGEGTIYGSILGALFFKLMTRVLVALSLPGQWEWVVTGATILVVVGLDQFFGRLREERARRTGRARSGA